MSLVAWNSPGRSSDKYAKRIVADLFWWMILFDKVATAKCATLLGPISLANVSTHNVASDLAMIDLVHTSMIVL